MKLKPSQGQSPNRTVKRFLVSKMGPQRAKTFIAHVQAYHVAFTRTEVVPLPVDPKTMYRLWASYYRSETKKGASIPMGLGGYNDEGFGYIPPFGPERESYA